MITSWIYRLEGLGLFRHFRSSVHLLLRVFHLEDCVLNVVFLLPFSFYVHVQRVLS